jgi:hypothetical protein
MGMFEEFDVVKLVESTVVEWDGEQVDLIAGQTGTVLDEGNQKSCLVDFTNDGGETIAMVSIPKTALELVWKASTRSYVDSRPEKTAS